MAREQAKRGARRRSPWEGVPEERRVIMRANRRRDTTPELALRQALHRAGLRFRVDFPIRPPSGRTVRPDIVFPARRIAVYVDGCFWHGCPIHGTRATTNRAYWDEKIETNKARDTRTTAALEADGWTVLRFWEHDDPDDAAELVEAAIRARQDAGPSSALDSFSATH
jgi:DNA mismatch endonuclease (patch repair protein)